MLSADMISPQAAQQIRDIDFDSEPQNLDLGAGPRPDGGWIRYRDLKTEIRISHAATVARCHTLGGST